MHFKIFSFFRLCTKQESFAQDEIICSECVGGGGGFKGEIGIKREAFSQQFCDWKCLLSLVAMGGEPAAHSHITGNYRASPALKHRESSILTRSSCVVFRSGRWGNCEENLIIELKKEQLLLFYAVFKSFVFLVGFCLEQVYTYHSSDVEQIVVVLCGGCRG